MRPVPPTHRLGVWLWTRAETLRSGLAARTGPREAGYSTETIIVTVALVVMALTVTAILVPKVIAKAASINLGG